MVPTFAGRIYLNIAHRMMDIKKETYKILQNISNETTGEIAVCYTPEAGAHTIVTMVKRPIAPAFFPQSYVEADAPVVYFTVLSRQRWILSTAFLKGAYLTKPEKCFIALLMDYLHGQLACTM